MQPTEAPSQSASSAPLAPGFAVRLALFFSALFMVAGTKLPFLPVWLEWRGLDKAEIALVTAAPLFLRILGGPLVAMAADWWGNRRQAIVLLASLALAGAMALSLAAGFWSILVLTLIGAFAAMGLMPLAETLAMSGVRRGGLDYGRMRLWGSVSFVIIGFVAGLAITVLGSESVIWLLVAGSFFTFTAALQLPGDPDAGGERKERPGFRAILRFAAAPGFLVFLLAAGSVQSSHAVFYTFGVIEWQRQGISATWAAALWSIGVATEIGLFAFSRLVVERVGPVGLIAAGAGSGLVRWLVMAFDPPLALLLPLQALHGFTFGAAHLGALHYMSAHVQPPQAATAQALYASATAGVGLGLATLLAGPLYASFGGYSYMAMAGLCVVGLAAVAVLKR